MNDQQSEAHKNVSFLGLSRFAITFLAFVTIFIFLQLFILPFTPIYFEGDQLVPVTNALRLLDGEVMYRDFFFFAPPGTELYYAALFSFFGARIWILNLSVFLLAFAQLVLAFLISKKVLSGIVQYLPTLIYFVIGFRLFGIDGSNRLFSVIFVLTASIVALRHSSRSILIAGALCGLSSFFVQTRGLLGIGAIGLFLLWEYWNEHFEIRKLLRDWTLAASAFLIVVIATQFYMAWLGGFDNYFFANVIFLKDYYGSDTLSNTFAYFSDIPDLNSYLSTYGNASGSFRFVRVAAPTLLFYFLVPLVYLVYFVYRRLRIVDAPTDRVLMLFSILGTVLFLGASAPTAYRLYHISIPALVVAIWLLSRIAKSGVILAALTAGLVLLGVLYSIQRQTVNSVRVDLPAGPAVFLNVSSSEKYLWLSYETTPGEYIYEAQHPTFYFPLHLRNPTPFYLIRDNNYTPVFQVEQLMNSLRMNPPRFIVWQGTWSRAPEDRRPGDNLAPLWAFIQTNYTFKREFVESGEFTVNSERDIEFWERKDDHFGYTRSSPTAEIP